ncbi:MAG: methyltransferase GidB [Solirubrobacterales bacterium]|nr:methyltransferase GidB [Solirubrobacterales bacterium]
MTAAHPRLRELCDGAGLSTAVADRLDVMLALLAADPTAPTTVVDPIAAVEVHVADAFDGLTVPALREASTVADIGAGAGFPGLVLAACLPATTFALVESVGKKCEFMGRLIEATGLDNALPVHARAEAWPPGIGRHDAVTARALAPLTALVEYAAPLLVEGGALVAWKGARDASEEADGLAAAEATGMMLEAVHAVAPRPGADRRHLHVFRKTAPTPARFPRREGMARKRPLTAG